MRGAFSWILVVSLLLIGFASAPARAWDEVCPTASAGGGTYSVCVVWSSGPLGVCAYLSVRVDGEEQRVLLACEDTNQECEGARLEVLGSSGYGQGQDLVFVKGCDNQGCWYVYVRDFDPLWLGLSPNCEP